MMPIVNIAAYKFVRLGNLEHLKAALKERADSLSLVGTIVLAEEGLNLFLAGSKEDISNFLEFLRIDPLFGGRFSDLEVKESFSSQKPFRRMVVRIAREIITMRHPTISPEDRRAPYVDAHTLKTWLDAGKDDTGKEVVLLDTRNDFEVEMGSFANAQSFDLERFSDFPAAIESKLKQEPGFYQNKTIVSFCTGGIRCEKAALFLNSIGLQNVFQLDGGILKYFELVGGDHWQGECFVFDERISLDPALKPSGRTMEERTAKQQELQKSKSGEDA